jgi:photosystem II stability/assembly factor-like uncharacterized protein
MKAAFLCVGLSLVTVGGCKKSGGGGGSGNWLVGTSGLMVNVQTDGAASGYDLASTETLNAIACRFQDEAWAVGNHATLLYTSDAGASWKAQPVPTTADLRALATQNTGPIFVAGNGVFLTSNDAGRNWTSLSDGSVNFRSVAAAQDGQTVLAVSEDGKLFSFENQQLVARGSFAGARVVAVSTDGRTAFLAGDNMFAKSVDAGRTWAQLTSPENVVFDDIRVDDAGAATAVGQHGTIAHIASDTTIAMQHIGDANLHTLHIAPLGDDYENIGVTAGDDGAVFMTFDGGWSWEQGPNVGATVLGADQIGDGHR